MAKKKKARAKAAPAPPKARPIRSILMVLVIVVIMGGIGGYYVFAHKTDNPVQEPVNQVETPDKPIQEAENPVEKPKNPIALIELAKGGTIELELYADDTPNTVANFVKLANKKFYDGLTFHRVEPGFVVQGGDPDGTGQGGPGYNIKDEVSHNLHVRGAVGMAKSSAPDSAGSQFYICLEAAPHLDGGYTVFGQVIKGMEYVDKIKVGDKMKTVAIKQ